MEEMADAHEFLPMGELPSSVGMGRYICRSVFWIMVVLGGVSTALFYSRGYSNGLVAILALLTVSLFWTLFTTRYVRNLYISREMVRVNYLTSTGRLLTATSAMEKVRYRYWLDFSNTGMHKWVLVIRVGGKRFRLTESRSNSLMQRNTFSRQQLNEINNLLFNYLKEQ